MRAQKRRPDAERTAAAKRARSRQLSHLGFRVEPIAGFDLQRGHALTDQCIQPRQRAGNQFSLAGCRVSRRPSRRCRRPRARSLRSLRPASRKFEFVRAVSAENQMGVTIHQSGRDPSPARSRSVPSRRRQMESRNGCLQRRCVHRAPRSRQCSMIAETGQILREAWRAWRCARCDQSARPCDISLNGGSLTGCIDMSIHIITCRCPVHPVWKHVHFAFCIGTASLRMGR